MSMLRKYETFEVREMLRNAEGVASPVTGIGAHSRGLHALRTPRGIGVNTAEMMARTHKLPSESNSQFKNRGGAVTTSAFLNLVHQADAACQALNSYQGKRVLTVFDSKLYADFPLRGTIDFGPIKEAHFLPESEKTPMKTVNKLDTAVRKPQGRAQGIRLIIDRGVRGIKFHIQTCMPLETMPALSYTIVDMSSSRPLQNV